MKTPIVYFDTSVFIGLIENQKGRRPTALDIIKYESDAKSKINTSILTVNEFIAKTYDAHHDQPNLKDKVDEVIQSIRDIAEIQGFSSEVAREAARLLSVWGRNGAVPDLPRNKKNRWDCIHLATANLIGAQRVYAWDNPWNAFPKNEIDRIGKIISPAVAPACQLTIDDMINELDS